MSFITQEFTGILIPVYMVIGMEGLIIRYLLLINVPFSWNCFGNDYCGRNMVGEE